MHAPERPQTLKSIATAQFSRVASSNVVNRAADIASRLRAQATRSNSPAGDDEGRSPQQGWGAWAWEKLPKRGNSTPDVGIEKVMLFPGWATRRYRGREGECMLKIFSGHYVLNVCQQNSLLMCMFLDLPAVCDRRSSQQDRNVRL